MKIKTPDLIAPALDWAVSQCVGIVWEQGDLDAGHYGPGFAPSSLWSNGGPIIEREKITIDGKAILGQWMAVICVPDEEPWEMRGPTPLIAAMRCYVAAKLGDEVEVPDELAPTCPHCFRTLEDKQELDSGLCSSDDCPRHDNFEDAPL
jgi:hypothetical protein